MYFGWLEIQKKPGEIHFAGSEMNFERPEMNFDGREMHLEAFCGSPRSLRKPIESQTLG